MLKAFRGQREPIVIPHKVNGTHVFLINKNIRPLFKKARKI